MNLRPMTMDDADKMLEWKNYPETRKFAIQSHDEIKKEAHYKWLKANLIWFQIIEDQHSNPIGAVRIFGGEISIWIDRNYWGLGVAERVINTVAKKDYYAKIVNGNTASFRAFVKAGFKPVGYSAVDNYYILQK